MISFFIFPYQFVREAPDLFIIFGKLSYGHCEMWPKQEQEAITNYLLALWRTPGPTSDDIIIAAFEALA